jgi:hypoxanthine-guanine phosphoribosyltransferase
MVVVAEHVDRKAEEIAARLSNQASHPVALVALGRGAESIRDAIAAAMSACGDRPSLATATMRLGNESRHAEWHISSEANLSRSHCVLVADVIGTGLTVDFAQRWLEGAGIPVRQIVTLFDRRSARLIDVPLAVPGLLAPSNWIVGAGLGGNQFAGLAAAHILAS